MTTPKIERERESPLLPTPVVNDMGNGKTVEQWDDWTAEMKERHGNGNGHGASLSVEVRRGFGPYEAAIRRHEQALGREAPEPTIEGKNGGRKLNPAFVEFMMMLDPGHVTGAPVTVNAMLTILGNGVVPPQGAAAVRILLGRFNDDIEQNGDTP